MGMWRAIRQSYRRVWIVFKWKNIRLVYLIFGFPLVSGIKNSDAHALGPFDPTNPRHLSMPFGTQTFDPDEVLHGTVSSSEQCDTIPQALWIEVEGKGDCIRYYGARLDNKNNARVMVYFGGDVMLRTRAGFKKTLASYAAQSPSHLQAQMESWSAMASLPAVFIARPGLYGSSGDHNARRKPREIALMRAALNQLKVRYGVGHYILAGQSGGGQIVAAMLSSRDDIEAVAISSGLLSVKQVSDYWEYRRDIPGSVLDDSENFYDPVDDVSNLPARSSPVIFIISDPEDATVPFYTQLRYVKALKRRGLNPFHFFANASGPNHHLLAEHAKLTAALFARGKTVREIRLALEELNTHNTECQANDCR